MWQDPTWGRMYISILKTLCASLTAGEHCQVTQDLPYTTSEHAFDYILLVELCSNPAI